MMMLTVVLKINRLRLHERNHEQSINKMVELVVDHIDITQRDDILKLIK